MLRPGPGSPAIGSAVGDYAAVVVDLDGQPRRGRKDRGADEASTAPVVNEPLTVEGLLGLIHGSPRPPRR